MKSQQRVPSFTSTPVYCNRFEEDCQQKNEGGAVKKSISK
jgi:hypothetical protein